MIFYGIAMRGLRNTWQSELPIFFHPLQPLAAKFVSEPIRILSVFEAIDNASHFIHDDRHMAGPHIEIGAI
jgi:hypothetical protein